MTPERGLTFRSPSPIVVGVTGHRDLRDEDIATLEGHVDRFFLDVRERYPHSDILVLSGVAAGADQLIARRATALNIPYVAVLPMKRTEYQNDFTGAERPAFERTCDGAAFVVELPYLEIDDEQRVRTDGARRSAHYDALGTYLVRHSAILVALWNGDHSNATGGTSQVVARAERGLPPEDGTVLSDLVSRMRPFVYHIVTPRASDPRTVGTPFATPALRDSDAPVLESIERQDRWNAAAIESGAASDGFNGDNVVERSFEIADRLAIRDQSTTKTAIERVHLYAMISGIAFTCYAHIPEVANGLSAPFAATLGQELHGLILVFFCFTVLSIVLVRAAHDADVQSRFQDYRALAEGLRVQAAWMEAGLDDDVVDHYLRKHRTELDWIRRTLRVAWVLHALQPFRPRPAATSFWTRLTGVHQHWIVPQRDYFERAASRCKASARRTNSIAVGFFFSSVVFGAILTADGVTEFFSGQSLFDRLPAGILPWSAPPEPTLQALLLAIVGSSAIVAALVKSQGELLGYRALGTRYALMHRIFSSASDYFVELGAPGGHAEVGRAHQLVLDLGGEALAENGEWVLAQRDRPLEWVWAG